MEQEVFTLAHDSSQRIAHACQLCREKRVRCSGHRPVCQRCQQMGADCVYGFARGDRRRSLLAALDQHNARADHAALGPGADQADDPSPPKLTISTGEPPSVDDNAEGDDIADDTTESSLHSPIESKNRDSLSEASQTKRAAKKQPRRARISSACLECKKRRRKCTGETPCQTCKTFQTECIYDRSQDRRSKAYFQKKINDSVREAVESDNMDGVLKLLHQNDEYGEVATDLQAALSLAEGAKPPHLSQTSSSMSTPKSQIVCEQFCGIGTSTLFAPSWCPTEARQRQQALLNGPQQRILPYIIPDDSPLSLSFSNFIDAVRHMVGEGLPLSQVLGPHETSVDLLFRERRTDDIFTSCTWACEIARIYAHIDIFTQLANAFLLSRFMRWVLDPTIENYIMLPDIMKPTHAQRVIPHYASADLYSLPAIRDSLVRGELRLAENIGVASVHGVKFEWPFDLEQAIDRCPKTGVVTISRMFAACASEEKNWSCSKDFLENFPEVKGHLNVVKHQHSWDQLQVM